jgi:hypothetical protein
MLHRMLRASALELSRRLLTAPALRTAAALVAAVCAVAAVAAQPARRPAPGRQDFPHVKDYGSAVSVFDDRIIRVVAAYYYAQREHSHPWILVEFGIRAQQAVRLERARVEIETPSGDIVPLSGQRRWGADGRRAQQLLQQITPTRHQVRSYFGSATQVNHLRFFSRPEDGYTVVDSEEIVFEPITIGDLLFESPTGAWDPGRHVLVIGHDLGVARLPIDLR